MHLENQNQNIHLPFPIARHLEEENIPLVRSGEIVVQNNDFDSTEIRQLGHRKTIFTGILESDGYHLRNTVLKRVPKKLPSHDKITCYLRQQGRMLLEQPGWYFFPWPVR